MLRNICSVNAQRERYRDSVLSGYERPTEVSCISLRSYAIECLRVYIMRHQNTFLCNLGQKGEQNLKLGVNIS